MPSTAAIPYANVYADRVANTIAPHHPTKRRSLLQSATVFAAHATHAERRIAVRDLGSRCRSPYVLQTAARSADAQQPRVTYYTRGQGLGKLFHDLRARQRNVRQCW